MNESVSDPGNRQLTHKAVEVSIRLAIVAGLAYWCFLIFSPFLMPLVLGVVIAVALSPMFSRFESLLGGRRKLAGTLFILLGVGALVVPSYLLSGSFFEGVRWLGVQESQDAITVPPPHADVADWPFIGDRVHDMWTAASENLEATLGQFEPQVRSFSSWLFSTLMGFGQAVLVAIVAIVIAGVMLMHPESSGGAAHTL